MPQNSQEYPVLKNNLRVFNSILKRTIKEAKIKYYENRFNQYECDIKMTWKTISEIICKSNSKRKQLEKIIVDSKVVLDKREMCERFNNLFYKYWP